MLGSFILERDIRNPNLERKKKINSDNKKSYCYFPSYLNPDKDS